MYKKIKNTIRALLAKWNDPAKSLEREYSRLLLEARNLQRAGDIPAFAKKTREADDVYKKIQSLKGE